MYGSFSEGNLGSRRLPKGLLIASMSIVALILLCIFVIDGSDETDAEPTSIGDSECYWELDGTFLKITGSGDMPDLSSNTSVWGRGITSVTISEGVTAIGARSFYGCDSLTTVSLPDSLNVIEGAAFYGCTSLSSINLPSNLDKIGMRAFEGTGLNSVTVPDKTTMVGSYAFCNCSSLKTAVIGNSVLSLGECLFDGCNNLETLTVGKSVVQVISNVFRGCVSLDNITNRSIVPLEGGHGYWGPYESSDRTDTSVKVACSDDGRFNVLYNSVSRVCQIIGYTGNEETVTIDSVNVGGVSYEVISIAPRSHYDIKLYEDNKELFDSYLAFKEVDGMKHLVIGDSVREIEQHSFYNCYNIVSVEFGNGLIYFSNEAIFCEKTTSVKYPPNINTSYVDSLNGQVYHKFEYTYL